jgi:hypothetical protein
MAGGLDRPEPATGRRLLHDRHGSYVSEVTPPHSYVYRSCGSLTRAGFQGISTGWADTYTKWLAGQLFLLDDPGEPVAPGDYVIRITANPPFARVAGKLCPAGRVRATSLRRTNRSTTKRVCATGPHNPGAGAQLWLRSGAS